MRSGLGLRGAARPPPRPTGGKRTCRPFPLPLDARPAFYGTAPYAAVSTVPARAFRSLWLGRENALAVRANERRAALRVRGAGAAVSSDARLIAAVETRLA